MKKTNITLIQIALVLSGLQILDGLLTSIGVSRFGTAVEGNPLLRNLMEDFGVVPTIALLKIMAIMAIFVLVAFESRFRWIKGTLCGLSCVYLLFAVAPWTYLLFIRPLI